MDLLFVKIAHAGFDETLQKVNTLFVNPVIKALFALAIIYFLYGVLDFFINQDNEEKKTASKNHMLWGIIGIAIMMSVFGILKIITKTFNLPVDVERNQVNLPR